MKNRAATFTRAEIRETAEGHPVGHLRVTLTEITIHPAVCVCSLFPKTTLNTSEPQAVK